ncbi:protein-L-isoaspartate O-methyltransferase family protein [Tunturiibacter gelidoferens]|uniref:Protein-L-isoaspartate O-methyltransferase n=1 Tax=Tunturiibacter lichenicola TaxID=2051959 RepID=A0A7Y9T1R0_9BACT|nr:rRNA adenine N-6-methyltransferase family protein [Edaphobacter lichenicola]NYF50322.1 protein-L-isoaspartate(D-aspartate) O-methyltransferase [Edaphobacter lichenicola]
MTEEVNNHFTLEQLRRFYSEELRIVAGLESPDLVSAFARVPRERYLGAPPWKFSSGTSVKHSSYRTTSSVCDVYHDVFVALESKKFLNNGQPSIIARLIAALKLSPGKRAFHCGCGTGYYTAIMAEVVGSRGSVVAAEIDSTLAEIAVTNLMDYDHVKVLNRDGADVDPVPCDAILINAGVTHPHPAWLDCLSEGGVLVLPLSVGRQLSVNDAMVLGITRRHNQFAAEILSIITIYSSPSMRDPILQSMLNDSFESHAMLRLKSVRKDHHDRTDTCIVHAPGFCLSAVTI